MSLARGRLDALGACDVTILLRRRIGIEYGACVVEGARRIWRDVGPRREWASGDTWSEALCAARKRWGWEVPTRIVVARQFGA